MNDMTKKCSKCGKSKSVSLFYHHPSTRDRYASICIACQKLKDKAKYSLEQERLKKERYRKAILATRNLQQAIKRGEVKKEPCWFCGKKKVQGHHLLYSFPKKVIWVCTQHHSEIHNRERYV